LLEFSLISAILLHIQDRGSRNAVSSKYVYHTMRIIFFRRKHCVMNIMNRIVYPWLNRAEYLVCFFSYNVVQDLLRQTIVKESYGTITHLLVGGKQLLQIATNNQCTDAISYVMPLKKFIVYEVNLAYVVFEFA